MNTTHNLLTTFLFVLLQAFSAGVNSAPEINTANVEPSFVPTNNEVETIYDRLEGVKPPQDLFAKFWQGYTAMQESEKVNFNQDVVTLIDFRLSSNQERLWVIDLNEGKVLFNTLVAHGRNTGNEYARHFSNQPESHKSSLGFYLTDKTYYGKHGLSLLLEGLEEGVNDKARERAIVIHGANYVSTEFINKHGRLGRSFGCPSLPVDLHEEIINTIKEGTCLFIYYPDAGYEQSSALLNTNVALGG